MDQLIAEQDDMVALNFYTFLGNLLTNMRTNSSEETNVPAAQRSEAQVQAGGYPEDMFVFLSEKEKEEYTCIICYCIIKDANQCRNGHKFCYSCIYAWCLSPGQGRDCCPVCRCEGIYAKSPQLTAKIGNKRVKCCTEKCNWRGFLRDYEEHEHRSYDTAELREKTELPSLSGKPVTLSTTKLPSMLSTTHVLRPISQKESAVPRIQGREGVPSERTEGIPSTGGPSYSPHPPVAGSSTGRGSQSPQRRNSQGPRRIIRPTAAADPQQPAAVQPNAAQRTTGTGPTTSRRNSTNSVTNQRPGSTSHPHLPSRGSIGTLTTQISPGLSSNQTSAGSLTNLVPEHLPTNQISASLLSNRTSAGSSTNPVPEHLSTNQISSTLSTNHDSANILGTLTLPNSANALRSAAARDNPSGILSQNQEAATSIRSGSNIISPNLPPSSGARSSTENPIANSPAMEYRRLVPVSSNQSERITGRLRESREQLAMMLALMTVEFEERRRQIERQAAIAVQRERSRLRGLVEIQNINRRLSNVTMSLGDLLDRPPRLSAVPTQHDASGPANNRSSSRNSSNSNEN